MRYRNSSAALRWQAMGLIAAAIVLAPVAHAQSFALKGSSGYLSEWELSGDVSEQPGKLLVGSVTMKHTGLCSVGDPEESAGDFRGRIVHLRSGAQIEGELVVKGKACSFRGPYTGHFAGVIDCADAKGVPIAFTLERAREPVTASSR